MSNITVRTTHWHQDRAELADIRRQVFVEEQCVDEQLEWDNQDENAEHFIAYRDGIAIGCARLIDHKKIGRMAVLQSERSNGIGTKILDHIKRHASQKRYTRLELDAQCHAFLFYYNNGFTAYSEPFDDAGIPHIKMEHRVFAEEQQDFRYVLNQDDAMYRGSELLDCEGFLDMALCQTRRSIIISVKDLNHPITRHPMLISHIKRMAKLNRHFNVCLLLNMYHPSYNEHPLFRLQDRLPSFIDIRVAGEAIPTKWIFDGCAWYDYETNNCRVVYGDRPRCSQLLERYKRWWQSASAPLDARRLSI